MAQIQPVNASPGFLRLRALRKEAAAAWAAGDRTALFACFREGLPIDEPLNTEKSDGRKDQTLLEKAIADGDAYCAQAALVLGARCRASVRASVYLSARDPAILGNLLDTDPSLARRAFQEGDDPIANLLRHVRHDGEQSPGEARRSAHCLTLLLEPIVSTILSLPLYTRARLNPDNAQGLIEELMLHSIAQGSLMTAGPSEQVESFMGDASLCHAKLASAHHRILTAIAIAGGEPAPPPLAGERGEPSPPAKPLPAPEPAPVLLTPHGSLSKFGARLAAQDAEPPPPSSSELLRQIEDLKRELAAAHTKDERGAARPTLSQDAPRPKRSLPIADKLALRREAPPEASQESKPSIEPRQR